MLEPVGPIDVVMLGTFSTWKRGTLQARALPIARELTTRGYKVAIVTTPWDQPTEAGVHERVGRVSIFNSESARPSSAFRAVAHQVAIARSLSPRLVHVF